MANYKLSLKDLKRKKRTLEDNRDSILKTLIPVIQELEEINIYIEDFDITSNCACEDKRYSTPELDLKKCFECKKNINE